MKRTQREAGMALPITLLFTGVILGTIAMTVSTVTMGSRRGSADERLTYQALLVSESALNTFPQRLAKLSQAQQFRGTPSTDRLNQWLSINQLRTYTIAEGRQATLSFEATSDPNVFALLSTGTAPGATQVVAQDFRVSPQAGIQLRIDAPLTSYPNVSIRGGAQVVGEAAKTSNGGVKIAQVESTVALNGSYG